MLTVNPYLLHEPLNPIQGMADDGEADAAFAGFNQNSEDSLRALARLLLVPHVDALGRHGRDRIELTYRYYLTKPDTNFERVFNSALLPFETPAVPRSFFLIVYEECFRKPFVELTCWQEYEERPDVEEGLRL